MLSRRLSTHQSSPSFSETLCGTPRPTLRSATRLRPERARAKQLGYDAIHDTVHEMAKDEARHGAGFYGLYTRFFGKK